MTGILWLAHYLLLSCCLACLARLNEACPERCRCERKRKVVNCSGNNFSELPAGLPAYVQTLLLNDNHISSLDRRASNILKNLTGLRKLYLENNNIRHIPPDVFPNSLRGLRLNGNRVTKLESGAFHYLENLAWVNLRGNRIRRIQEDAFPPYLTMLDLRNNRLKEAKREMFASCRELHNLDLSSNMISYISPDVFPSDLRVLDLSFNQLTHVGPELSHLVKLRVLFLNMNHITKLAPNSFWKKVMLEELSLLQNRIKYLEPGQFQYQTNLTTLNLAKNELQSIPERAFPPNINFERLYIHHNPLRCTCAMRWMAEYLSKPGVNEDRYNAFYFRRHRGSGRPPPVPPRSDIFCATPEMYSGVRLTETNFEYCDEDVTQEPGTLRPTPGLPSAGMLATNNETSAGSGMTSASMPLLRSLALVCASLVVTSGLW